LENAVLLIADSGATKTDWLLTLKGQELARFQSVGMNPFYQDKLGIAEILRSEVVARLNAPVDQIFFYGSGCADDVVSKPVKDALVETIEGVRVVRVASDMLGAARGLCGREKGIACILGTGANNAYYDGAEIVKSVGSLGFWMGDEGSGSYLGKALVVHFLQNELPADLHDLFQGSYPEVNRLLVLDHAYRKPYPNRYFATFSSFIGEHIGHPFLYDMVSNAFAFFVNKYVLKHNEAHKVPIHFTGSVAFHYQQILKEVLRNQNLTAGRILKSPLMGLMEYHSGH
jgi:glucosamine kinase